MDFFQAQDDAKRRTRWLVFWYVTILFAISLMSSLVIMLLTPIFNSGNRRVQFENLYSLDNWLLFLAVFLFIFVGGALTSWFKSRQLAKGGAAVAESLGGQLVAANTQNPLEKRALNIVQEMAIAANLPTPPLYLLKEETNINAFAAGIVSTDAVVAITRGALERLNREQLQGVIAHEFSHILNGDMRLNFRLISLLYGIEFISALGRFLLPRRNSHNTHRFGRSTKRSKKRGSHALFILVGVLLSIIGWFGQLASKILQAAVSRQREFLADASAVQFTRDPDSIGGALQVLAHHAMQSASLQDDVASKIEKSDAQTFAHLFFAKALHSKLSWFSTHPPLKDRIRKIYPNWQGETLPGLPLQNSHSDQTQQSDSQTSNQQISLGQVNHENMLTLLPVLLNVPAGSHSSHIDSESLQALESLIAGTAEPLDAVAIVLLVLLARQNALDCELLETVHASGVMESNDAFPNLSAMFIKYCESFRLIPEINNLSLISLSIQALQQLSTAQKQAFCQLAQQTAEFDHSVSLFEQAVLEILQEQLIENEQKETEFSEISSLINVDMELRILLSFIIQTFSGIEPNQVTFDYICRQFGLKTSDILQADAIPEHHVQSALKKLSRLKPELKSGLLNVLVDYVQSDNHLSHTEEEVILAVSMGLKAPIPRFSLVATNES